MSKNTEPKITEMQLNELEKLGASSEEEFITVLESVKNINKNIIKMSNIISKIKKTKS
jgi:hypothetical protein